MAQPHPYIYRAELERVVDGDTHDYRIDLGFKIEKKVRVRLRDVDTDEVYGVKKESDEYQRGKRQSDFVKETLLSAEEIIVRTFKDDTGKFDRFIAKVEVDGENLAELIKDKFPHLK